MIATTVDCDCPHCGARNQDRPWGAATLLSCGACHQDLAPALDEQLGRCPTCRSDELYAQRDFNRKVGVAAVVVAVLLAWPTRGLSLLALVIIDFALHQIVPPIAICYRCHCIVRGAQHGPTIEGFDMAIEDKYRLLREANERSPVEPAQ